MKFLVAITLVIVAIVAAEPQVFQQETEDGVPPYEPRGWRPNGPTFNPTIQDHQAPKDAYLPPNEFYSTLQSEQPTTPRFKKREQAPEEPSSSFGSPSNIPHGNTQNERSPREQAPTEPSPLESSFPTTRSEASTERQAENIQSGSRNEKLRSNEPQVAVRPEEVYVVLPQAQSLIYAAPLTVAKAEPLVESRKPKEEVETVKEPSLAPVQAVPALAKIQAPVLLANYEQVSQLLQLQKIQAIPVARYVSSLSQTSVLNPYSSSFVQIYQ